MRKFLLGFLACFVLGITSMSADNATEPSVHGFKFDDNGTINKMSDNGLWAVAYALNPSNTVCGINPRLLNLSDFSSQVLTEGEDPAMTISASAFDVTDKGDIVVGEFNLMPGYWKTADQSWVDLPLGKKASGGEALAITPDGKYAVGHFTYEENPDADYPYMETEALWDIENNKLIAVEGLPKLDMANENKKQNRFVDISADGNTILGCMSISYWPTGNYAGGKCFYIYNLKAKSYKFIGFIPNDKQPWTPIEKGTTLISAAVLSSNGLWTCGTAQMAQADANQEFNPEYTSPYLYDTANDIFTMFNKTDDNGVDASCVTNDGIVLGATPDNNPYREWGIRSGKYWFPIDQVLKQKYGYDLKAKNGLENTGTPVSISNDNRTIAVMGDPESSYVITLPDDINTICQNINLLNNYTVYPQPNSEISKLQKITITFDRDIQVLGGKNSAEIHNAEGQKVYASIGFKAGDNTKTLNITFRSGALEANQNYSLFIPAGSISLIDDDSKKNENISINYIGRANVPVAVVKTVPENKATIAKIDAATSPVILTFDANIIIPEQCTAKMYRANEETAFCDLAMGFKGKDVALYPTNPQMLYKGANYKIVVPAGCITDVTGNNANEEIVLNYTGAYEREISSDDKILFSDNFDMGLTNFLLFDGDKNKPNETMQGWGFADGINFPWSIVRDNETSEDMAAASHSMYTPAGQSNDWLIIPQTYIPDNLCVLKFQSQSYLKNAKDKLKVIVWASDDVYNVLNETIVDKIYKEGTVVYNKIQTPGKDQDLLEGEWTDNTVELRDFAGKNVYIAFLNENTNQSAIFLNNVEVFHNIPFLVTFDNETKVTAQSEIMIKGRITVDSDTEVYQTAHLALNDAEGKTIDELNLEGLNLKKGDTQNFSFTKLLPLEIGKFNKFSVTIKMNDTENNILSGVKNLSFTPVKRVVLEEYTGMNCPNCPLGILAIEKIKNIYGKQFLPIALHCYPGDQLGTGLENYSNYFSFTGAPSGMIQRSGIISSPMVSVEQDYRFNGVNGDKLWLDLVQDEMSIAADAEIDATIKIDSINKTVELPCNVRYAMDTEELNVNLFVAFTEDNVNGYQQNNLSGISDPDLGDFGANGKYAKSMIYPFAHNHVARGWYGSTIAGTGGLIPASVEAGKNYSATITAEIPANVKDLHQLGAVIMMIDANTGRVINAAEVSAKDNITGIEEEVAANNLVIETLNHQVVVNSPINTRVEVFTTDGRKIAQVNGNGIMAINTNGYHGVAIVKASTANLTLVKKVML